MAESSDLCRVCLSRGAKHNIYSTRYHDVFERLTSLQIILSERNLCKVCTLCMAHLRTCYNLWVKSMVSDSLLNNLQNSGKVLTDSYDVIELQRHQFNLNNHFVIIKACAISHSGNDADSDEVLNGDFLSDEEDLPTNDNGYSPEQMEEDESEPNDDKPSLEESNTWKHEKQLPADDLHTIDVEIQQRYSNQAVQEPVTEEKNVSIQIHNEDDGLTSEVLLEIPVGVDDAAEADGTPDNQLDRDQVETDSDDEPLENIRQISSVSDVGRIVSSNDQEVMIENLTSTDNVDSFTTRSSNKSGNDCFICDYCCRSFDDKILLSLHIAVHGDIDIAVRHEARDSPPREVTRTEESSSARSNRADSGGFGNVRQLRCNKCEYDGLSTEDLARHMKNHKTPKHLNKCIFNCSKCDYRHTSYMNVYRHFSDTHRMAYVFNCVKCSFESRDKFEFMAHLKRHAVDKMYECSECVYKTKCTNVRDMVGHLCSHTGEKTFKCLQCGYKTWRYSSYRVHNTSCSKPPQDKAAKAALLKVKCDVCDYRCSSNSIMNLHKIRHVDEKPHECKICKKSFKRIGGLKNHLTTHATEKPFACCLCDYKGSNASYLKSHMRSHSGKMFKCTLCKSTFYLQWQLDAHSKTHTEPPLECSFCDYKTHFKGAMKLHTARHIGERKFKCKLCSFASFDISSLEIHLLCHTGEKPFQCEQCGFKCNRHDNLRKHVRIHTGEKPFKCALCDFKTANKSNLNLHLKKHK